MVGFLEVEETETNMLETRLYTRRHAKSFYFASHVLPRQKRMAAYAVYAFCRYADNLVDHDVARRNSVRALQRVAELRNQLRYAYNYSELMNPKLRGFRETVHTYQIPQDYFLDLLRGVEMDLNKTRYASFNELQEYCYCVASTVGLIMARIFGVSDDGASQHAAELGTAMQLTNILRDVGEDYRLGRMYIPADELAEFDYSEEKIARGVVNSSFRELMAFQVARAREYYARASSGIPMITNDGSQLCVRLMSAIYAGILRSIERNGYDVFSRRAFVSTGKKFWLALGSLMPTRLGGSAIASVRPVGRSEIQETNFSYQVKPWRSEGLIIQHTAEHQ
jgi:15-cis-phytoene synthase